MCKAYLPLLCLTLAPCLCGADQDHPAAGESGQKAKTEQAASSAAGSKQEDDQRPAIVGGAPLDPKAYEIGPEDVLMIRVWREPELSGQFAVRPDGKISMPLINEVMAAGKTPEKLATDLGDRLTKFMNRPEVTVAVQQVNSKKYFIQGEVGHPGAFPLTVPTTVLEALSNAGGFRDFANTKKIIILRGSQRFKFNYKEVTKGKSMDQNIQLLPGDQIIVP